MKGFTRDFSKFTRTCRNFPKTNWQALIIRIPFVSFLKNVDKTEDVILTTIRTAFAKIVRNCIKKLQHRPSDIFTAFVNQKVNTAVCIKATSFWFSSKKKLVQGSKGSRKLLATWNMKHHGNNLFSFKCRKRRTICFYVILQILYCVFFLSRVHENCSKKKFSLK